MPEPILNPFDNAAYSMTTLTEMVNNIKYLPGLLAADGVFDEMGVPTWDIAFDLLNDNLKRPGTRQPGGEPNIASIAKAVLKKLTVHHIPYVDRITPRDVQGVRLPGESGLASGLTVIGQKQARIIREIDLAHEWFRMSAIQGAIREPGDNTTTLADADVLIDFADEFDGKVPTPVDFLCDVATTDVRARCMAALRAMDDALQARPRIGAIGYLSATAFDNLTGHPLVRDSFKYTQSVQSSTDLRAGWAFGGILWKEYRQRLILTAPATWTPEFIPDDIGYIVPMGARVFRTFYAPAMYFETANQPGVKFTSKIVAAPDNASAELQVQSNPLFINTNPDAVIVGTFAAVAP